MDSIGDIIKSIKLKKNGFVRWWIVLVIGFIFLVFSIYIIVTSSEITELLIRIIGGFLIVDAIMDFLMTLKFVKNVKEEVKDIKVIEE